MTEPNPGDVTNPITPEVRAAIERQRDARNGQVPWEYTSTKGEVYDSDLAAIRDAMLSLLPPGMPEPVEMWAGVSNRTGEIVGSAWDIPRNTVPCRIRGMFVPLERVES